MPTISPRYDPAGRKQFVNLLVGIDIQPIEEVESSLRTFGSRYRRLLFTDRELEICGDNSTTSSRLAARFAAKEAVLKILDIHDVVPSWRSIEVGGDSDCRPEIILYDVAAELARARGIRDVFVSLSRGGDVAVATVVASAWSQSEGVSP
jgi:holo-[acyl-carrier protein] synthase